ncbi:uncharacterized protein LOC103501331 isoform X3 [Cucumis melo]|uniref:Uncharacterized protein LOC103501331 isoform X3 n=1 Tax=Cucumis melo TaxID=3656 RepID=A0ABM3KMA6_CUCME|nr:uncharacterized protein LOC103501331 isoform X3 [Cucumis melo]
MFFSHVETYSDPLSGLLLSFSHSHSSLIFSISLIHSHSQLSTLQCLLQRWDPSPPPPFSHRLPPSVLLTPLRPLPPSPLYFPGPSLSQVPESYILYLRRLNRFDVLGCRNWAGRFIGLSKNPSTKAAVITAASSAASVCIGPALEVQEIRERSNKWQWNQYSINYFVSHYQPQQQPQSSSSPVVLLVHGFGASIPHWRRNISTLSQYSTVYAIDLLGFGASDKPAGFAYTMETWAELVIDFVDQIIKKPTVLVGNSVGSLACVIAASDSSRNLVRGLVLLNCAGGMNNKAIVDDWRIKLLLPLLWLVDFLLNQRIIASALFKRVKKRDSLRNILSSVYGNKESVDEDLIDDHPGQARLN